MTEKEFICALRQNQERVQDILAHTDKLVLVGAGNTCTLYEKAFAVENMPIAGIVDNNPGKIGKCFLGGGKMHTSERYCRKFWNKLACHHNNGNRWNLLGAAKANAGARCDEYGGGCVYLCSTYR